MEIPNSEFNDAREKTATHLLEQVSRTLALNNVQQSVLEEIYRRLLPDADKIVEYFFPRSIIQGNGSVEEQAIFFVWGCLIELKNDSQIDGVKPQFVAITETLPNGEIVRLFISTNTKKKWSFRQIDNKVFLSTLEETNEYGKRGATHELANRKIGPDSITKAFMEGNKSAMHRLKKGMLNKIEEALKSKAPKFWMDRFASTSGISDFIETMKVQAREISYQQYGIHEQLVYRQVVQKFPRKVALIVLHTKQRTGNRYDYLLGVSLIQSSVMPNKPPKTNTIVYLDRGVDGFGTEKVIYFPDLEHIDQEQREIFANFFPEADRATNLQDFLSQKLIHVYKPEEAT